jgi:hypothetical protein
MMEEKKKQRKNIPKNMLLCVLCCGICSVRSIFNQQIVDTGRTELQYAGLWMVGLLELL